MRKLGLVNLIHFDHTDQMILFAVTTLSGTYCTAKIVTIKKETFLKLNIYFYQLQKQLRLMLVQILQLHFLWFWPNLQKLWN